MHWQKQAFIIVFWIHPIQNSTIYCTAYCSFWKPIWFTTWPLRIATNVLNACFHRIVIFSVVLFRCMAYQLLLKPPVSDPRILQYYFHFNYEKENGNVSHNFVSHFISKVSLLFQRSVKFLSFTPTKLNSWACFWRYIVPNTVMHMHIMFTLFQILALSLSII